jgi:hypothetical protein
MGFDALDIDPRNGGDAWYRQNFDALPLTQCHMTRSGGLHMLFRHAEGVRNSSGKIAPGVDVRGDGGFVIWWPREGLPAEYNAISEWPRWLLGEVRRPLRAKVSMGASRGGIPDLGGRSTKTNWTKAPRTRNPWARRYALLRQVRQAPKGGRTEKLFWASERFCEMALEEFGGRIWRKHRNAALQRYGEDLIQAAVECGLVADYGEAKVITTIRDGFRWVLEGKIDR